MAERMLFKGSAQVNIKKIPTTNGVLTIISKTLNRKLIMPLGHTSNMTCDSLPRF